MDDDGYDKEIPVNKLCAAIIVTIITVGVVLLLAKGLNW